MYSQEVAERICERLSAQSLRRICAEEGMPDRRTVERWMREDADFAAKCARARETHAHHIVEGMEEIEEGVLSGDIRPDAAKVVISSRQWRAEKLSPKVYGVKTAHEITGADGKAIEFTHIERAIVDPVARAVASDEGNNTSSARAAHAAVETRRA